MFECWYAHWYKNVDELPLNFKQFYGETSETVYESNVDFRIISCQR